MELIRTGQVEGQALGVQIIEEAPPKINPLARKWDGDLLSLSDWLFQRGKIAIEYLNSSDANLNHHDVSKSGYSTLLL
jgi:hypothetical protein